MYSYLRHSHPRPQSIHIDWSDNIIHEPIAQYVTAEQELDTHISKYLNTKQRASDGQPEIGPHESLGTPCPATLKWVS